MCITNIPMFILGIIFILPMILAIISFIIGRGQSSTILIAFPAFTVGLKWIKENTVKRRK